MIVLVLADRWKISDILGGCRAGSAENTLVGRSGLERRASDL